MLWLPYTHCTLQTSCSSRLDIAYSFLLLDCYKTRWFIILHDGLVALEFFIHLNKDIALFILWLRYKGNKNPVQKQLQGWFTIMVCKSIYKAWAVLSCPLQHLLLACFFCMLVVLVYNPDFPWPLMPLYLSRMWKNGREGTWSSHTKK